VNPWSVVFATAVVVIPFLAVGGLLWLSGRIRRREAVRINRQIALTDAIHWELGAAAAPEVRQGWLGGWTVSVSVPFQQEATVGAVVRITHEFFSKLDSDAPRLRIVLTPEVRPVRLTAMPPVTGPATRDLTRAA
jgi:hypothetical protein